MSDEALPRRAEALVQLAAADGSPAELYARAVGMLAEQLDVTVAVYEPTPQGLALAASAGPGAPPAVLPALPEVVPPGWTRVQDDRSDVAVLVTGSPRAVLSVWSTAEIAYVQRTADVLGSGVARYDREDRLLRRERHFTEAQRISHVGSYDFDITRNTNDWSDQLYRIYGREPGSFMATYERFLEMVHPEDRDTIMGVHQEALATISPYQMEERILWPDGQLRTLASWGEVVPDAEGKPARMIGICWDITEQKASAEALRRGSERFQQLIASAPDVVLVVDADGLVVRANARLTEVLGYTPDVVLGRPVVDLLPHGLDAGETTALHRDGSTVPVDITTSHVELDDEPTTVAFVRDITDRKQHEVLAMRVHDVEVRRRHALEINDNVVQGLTSVLYLLDLQRTESAHTAARQTLDAARSMMSGLLSQAGGALVPGELVREQGHAATLEELLDPPPAPAGSLRVLLADDSPDIRLLLRLTLTGEEGFDVVGEAEDGAQAVRLAESLQPHVVILDLSMPVMDGLQAIPELLRVHPDVRIVVLSGFDEVRMKQAALDLGAHDYLEKGQAISSLVTALDRLFPNRAAPSAPDAPADPDRSLPFDGDMLAHELRTPLTVITGMLSTLRDRMDTLPSATSAELLQAALRNARQMAALLDALADVRHASDGRLSLMPEPTDVGRLVRTVVADLCAAHDWPSAHVSTPHDVVAQVDPVRIHQVLANLLSNAHKFAPTGSSVSVAVTVVGASVEITVSDEGPGVPPERRGELFAKFSRLGHSGAGMGLGLYISRAIARAHGGELSLQAGGGSTFCLSLPLHLRVSEPATS